MCVAVAGEGLVDGVVDDLVDEVVQTALARGADVHAGSLADCLKAFEDLDRGGVVGQADNLFSAPPGERSRLACRASAEARRGLMGQAARRCLRRPVDQPSS